jgi:hypothetical protein
MLLALLTLIGCRPDNIFFTVENHSGGTLHDVKVTYPGETITIGPLIGSSINLGKLDASTITGTFRHFDGPGNVTVTYSTEDGQSHTSSSRPVTGNEKGEVKISIYGSYASFDTKFEDSRQ